MNRPQKGKVGGKSKYYPKGMKPASEEQRKEMLEALTEKHKNVRDDEPNVMTRFDMEE